MQNFGNRCTLMYVYSTLFPFLIQMGHLWGRNIVFIVLRNCLTYYLPFTLQLLKLIFKLLFSFFCSSYNSLLLLRCGFHKNMRRCVFGAEMTYEFGINLQTGLTLSSKSDWTWRETLKMKSDKSILFKPISS